MAHIALSITYVVLTPCPKQMPFFFVVDMLNFVLFQCFRTNYIPYTVIPLKC